MTSDNGGIVTDRCNGSYRNLVATVPALALLMLLLPGIAVTRENTFVNPILAGGYPDPSICRSGDTYYLVNSSFEYFPGLPIHRSKDLVNWELAGYGLHREAQVTQDVNLVDVQSNGGIHAPTIRCHDGKFYIITTNVYLPIAAGQPTEFVNFIITADNVEGPWSTPHVLDGAPGIDPDIFFDDDGRVWYVGTHSPEKPNFPGEGEIWLQEIDLARWALKGERHFLWRGACGGVWAEGPHMYKRDGRYYLMVAEGGTSFNHAVVIAVSDEITGPYVSNARNPILTSRHLSYDNWVTSTGHADLFELPDGRWYMVALGIRGDEERHSNMGRETHLMPVVWEREPFEWKDVRHEWPVVAPSTGKVERYNPLPFEGTVQHRDDAFVDDFDQDSLGLEWNFRRFPVPGSYSLQDRKGFLRLYAKPGIIKERGRASLVGVRQKESDFSYSARMLFSPGDDGSESGLLLFQKDDNYISFTIRRQNDTHILSVRVAESGTTVNTIEKRTLDDYQGEIVLQVVSDDHQYRLDYSLDQGESFTDFARLKANHILSKGYTGAYLGLYSTANGGQSGDYADFDWIRYNGFQRP